MEYIHHYNSPLGRMTMASAGSGLTGLWFDGQKYFGSTIGQGGVSGDLPVFDETERWLDLYFSGQAPDFTPPLAVFTEDVPKHRQAASGDMKAVPAYRQPALTAFDTPLAGWATPFRQAVWKILMTVPYGETISYGQIAGRLSQQSCSAQAVGGAVGHNPITLIIPCHRVVGADGSLTGYAGGLERKAKLLEMERAKFK